MKKYKILVTGGAGFIGSHVVDKYVEDGHEVLVVDNLSSGRKDNINQDAVFKNEDIRDDKIIKIINDFKPQIINHMAAQVSVTKSIENPKNDAEINTLGLIKVLSTIKNGTVKKFIFTSTAAVYGDPKIVPTSEKTQVNPFSPYAISKYAGEKYVEFFCNQSNIPHVIFRPANVYGPRQRNDGEGGVISIFKENISNGKESYLYAPKNMPEGSIRDFIHVSDIANAHGIVTNGTYDGLFNLGTGKGTTITDAYTFLVNKYVDNKQNAPKLITKSARKGDINKSILDSSKAKDVLNWEAKELIIK